MIWDTHETVQGVVVTGYVATTDEAISGYRALKTKSPIRKEERVTLSAPWVREAGAHAE